MCINFSDNIKKFVKINEKLLKNLIMLINLKFYYLLEILLPINYLKDQIIKNKSSSKLQKIKNFLFKLQLM